MFDQIFFAEKTSFKCKNPFCYIERSFFIGRNDRCMLHLASAIGSRKKLASSAQLDLCSFSKSSQNFDMETEALVVHQPRVQPETGPVAFEDQQRCAKHRALSGACWETRIQVMNMPTSDAIRVALRALGIRLPIRDTHCMIAAPQNDYQRYTCRNGSHSSMPAIAGGCRRQ